MNPEDVEWNNSSLWLISQCGERFRRRVLDEERHPPTLPLTRGTLVHQVAAEAHKRQLEIRKSVSDPDARDMLMATVLPSGEEAADVAATRFEEAWRAGITVTREERKRGIPIVKGEAKDDAVEMSRLYVEEVAPLIRPVAVERRIEIVPATGPIKKIHGTMDLVDEMPAGERIRDIKTSKRSPRKDAADRSGQLTMYSMLRSAETGEDVTQVALDYVVRTQAGNMKTVNLESSRRAEDVEAYVRRIETSAEAARKGVFVPSDPSWDPMCSPRYCEFWSTCRYVSHWREDEAMADGAGE